jgi:hypothetical protein
MNSRWLRPVDTVLLSALLTLAGALAWAADPVGEVIFIAGAAEAVSGDQTRALARGDSVYEGEHLRTAEDGYLHVRFVDGGLVSVRPHSSAYIDTYEFDEATPDASRVRINLERGALRSATGKAGAASKDTFRINTPVSAIGIRGTDFVVFADESLARLAVQTGGVVMAPFSATCAATDFTPCTDGSAELFASLSKALLEVQAGQQFALITSSGPTPDELRPPHPEEARVFETVANSARAAAQTRMGLSAPGAKSYEDGLEYVGRYIDKDSLTQHAYLLGEEGGGKILPNDQGLVDDPQFIWGRWSSFAANDPSYQRISSLLSSDRRHAVVNDVFSIMEPRYTERPLPEAGRVTFQLNSYEAYIQTGRNLEDAGISNPALVVDFDTQRFATRLDVHAASLPGVVHVVGAGDLVNGGYLFSDSSSPARIDGVLSPNATEAGMLFDYQISPGVNAVGATHWINNTPD